MKSLMIEGVGFVVAMLSMLITPSLFFLVMLITFVIVAVTEIY